MKFLRLALCALLLAGCAGTPSIDDSYSARGQSSRVQYIVLHYTSTDFTRSLALLTQGEVSAHYLIDEGSAKVYRLVDENRRAWHAGDSSWQGRTWLNASTLGIELVNQGYVEGPDGRHWQPYDEAQIQALIALLKDLVKRHDLPIDSIIGHSDVAPQRKTNADTITDFSIDDGDMIMLDDEIFTEQDIVFVNKLKDKVDIDESDFDSASYTGLVYEMSTGKLYYDTSDSAGGELVVTLVGKPPIDSDSIDFFTAG